MMTMNSLYRWFGGRSTFVGVFGLVAGTFLAFHGKLTSEYAALLGVIQIAVTYRAIQQDKAEAPPAA
jgi:hypothetical protein